jgi:hypothetical protein
MALSPVSSRTGSTDPWVDAAETWTYASADAPTFTFTVAADVTTKYSPGMRVRLNQTTDKYFIITAVSSFSGGNTTITVYGGSDYTLANATISAPYYSVTKAPYGFPLDPLKWTQSLSDSSARSQASPVSGTWYNLGSLSLSVPIGAWDLSYACSVQNTLSAATGDPQTYCTLSTSNNSETDADLTCFADTFLSGTQPTLYPPFARRKHVLAASKTSYYILAKKAGSASTDIQFRGDTARTIIRAVCAYL